MNCLQIGALSEGSRRLCPQRSSALPLIVMACFVLLVACRVDLDQRAGFVERLGDRHPPAGAGHRPRRSHAVYEASIVIWVLHVDEAAGAAGGLLPIEQGEKE